MGKLGGLDSCGAGEEDVVIQGFVHESKDELRCLEHRLVELPIETRVSCIFLIFDAATCTWTMTQLPAAMAGTTALTTE